MSNIRVNSITDRLGTGSPDFPNGITIDTVTVSGKIVHTGDTDTSIGFPINDTITMDTAGTERLRIDSAGAITSSGDITALTLNSTVATGTAPFTVTSTTPVANLSIGGNAATVTNGFYTTSSFNLGTTSIAVNRASGAQTLTGISIDGNAATATTATTVAASAIATQAEAEAGTNNTGLMTPLRFRNALRATGTAPTYACRTWVHFNGQGVPAIKASGNVSSITDNGVGAYTLNFTTALPDVNYSVSGSIGTGDAPGDEMILHPIGPTFAVSSVKVRVSSGSGNAADFATICVAIFR